MTTVIVNAEQAAAWDGADGEQWAKDADHYEATDHRYDGHLSEAAAFAEDDAVLDVGCGSGVSTRGAALAARRAVGIDLSRPLLEEARRRAAAAGLSNVSFVHGDAQVHPLDTASYDVAISRFGAMFFGDPVAAFANIGRALRPGGRLAMLAWRPFASNEWLRVILGALTSGHDIPTPPNGAPGPFGLADAGDVTRILVAAEFVDVEVAAVDEPMWFGADTDDAFDFVRNFGIVDGVLGDADAAARGAALDRLRDALDVHATGDGVLMGSAAWLTTARRPG